MQNMPLLSWQKRLGKPPNPKAHFYSRGRDQKSQYFEANCKNFVSPTLTKCGVGWGRQGQLIVSSN